MDFQHGVLEFLRREKMLQPKGVLIVAVSGGADSIAMLHVLAGLRHILGISLHAAHFNHRTRPAAAGDERFVAAQCKQLNVPLIVGRRTDGQGPISEDAGRRMRHAFFSRINRRFKAQAVALAHTKNDLAETVLMRLLRGSGLYGLKGIWPQRHIQGVRFVRPLMAVDRVAVEHYLKTLHVTFRVDQTNRQKIYLRNKLRLELLPLLAKDYNPRISDVLNTLAATAGEDYEFLAAYAAKRFKQHGHIGRGNAKVELAYIGKEHPAVVRLIFRHMAQMLTDQASLFAFEHIRRLQELAGPQGKGPVHLPHGLQAVKTKKFLQLSQPLTNP